MTRIAAIIAAVVLPALLVLIGWLPPAACLVSLTVVVATVFHRLRLHAPALLLTFAGVALGITVTGQRGLRLSQPAPASDAGRRLAEQWRAKGPFDERLPIVVHIVFDEMLSPGSIDDAADGGSATREALYGFARTHGFRTFDSVYSRSYYSGISIPNMMNAEFERRTDLSALVPAIQEAPPDNAYFRAMAAQGYRTAVFDTAVIDFCLAPEVRLCSTFPSFDPARGNVVTQSLKTRALSLSQTLLRAYEPGYVSRAGLQVLAAAYGIGTQGSVVLGNAGRFDPQGFPGWFERFTTFLEEAPRGTHVFAHFLVPHAPYLLSETCEVGGRAVGGYELKLQVPDDRARVAARLEHYTRYLRQVNCVRNRLDDMMGRLRRLDTFRDARIVLHGDHGSRISNGHFIEDYSSRDFVDNYATYFAVSGPGVEPGIDCEFVALPQLFRRYMSPETPPAAAVAPLSLIVHSRAGADVRVEAPMPVFGCAAQGASPGPQSSNSRTPDTPAPGTSG